MSLELHAYGDLRDLMLSAWRGVRPAFQGLILGPSIAFGAVAAIAVGIGQSENIWGIILAVILVSVSLEIGYLSGTIINSLLIDEQAKQIVERQREFKQVKSR